MSTTILDVASKSGVSASTVSRAFNRPELVTEETRARVLRVAEELDFVPNSLARGLVTGRSGLVALFVQDISNPYFALVATGCEEELHQSGVAVTLCSTSESLTEEERFKRIFMERRVDGFIFVSSPADQESPEDPPLPAHPNTVYVQRFSDAPNIDSVCVDDRGGVELACDYLAGLGHHRIAIVTGQMETLSGQVRLKAFSDWMRTKGLDVPQGYVIPGDFKLESGQRAAQQLLACDPLPTAVFVSSDLMAYTLIHTLAKAGIGVPQDVSVIGFDDLPMSELFYPRLSTIWLPNTQLGAVAARLLLERLANPDLPGRQITLPVELKARDSCGSLL